MNIKAKYDSRIKMVMIWAIMIIFIGNYYVFSRVHYNQTEEAFEEPPAEGTASSATTSIKDLIINGAVSFLKASEYISSLSHQYELTELNGVNIVLLKEKNDGALESMKAATAFYSKLETQGNSTPYNQTVIDKLIAFDYRTFRKENGLNKQVMNDVEEYLICGDVRGVFSRTKNDAQNILNILEAIKSSLNNDTLPTNKTIWDLNQEVATFHLFGQYLTRVFSAIKNRVRS